MCYLSTNFFNQTVNIELSDDAKYYPHPPPSPPLKWMQKVACSWYKPSIKQQDLITTI